MSRPGREVHHRVGPPVGGPDHLLDLLLHPRGDRRVPDIGVDLDQETPPDDHGFGLRVVDIGGEDGAAARHLRAHQLRGDRPGRSGPAAALLRLGLVEALVLPDGHELHFGCDEPAPGVVHLGDVGAGLRPPRGARAREHEPRAGGGLGALAESVRRPFLDVTALRDPAGAQWRQARAEVDVGRRIGVRPRGVVDRHRVVGDGPESRCRIGQPDLAHGDA